MIRKPLSEALLGLPAALAIWFAAALAFALSLPLFPIDETRYLTVAWEMRESGHWLLPTLNGAPYSHKPPLLMWLVNLFWIPGGPEISVARLVPVLVTAGVIGSTYALARALFPERRDIAVLSLAFLMMPAFFVYGGLLMFDQLLGLFIVLSLLSLWKAAQKPCFTSWALLGIAMGFGLLAKGPVALLHVLLPAAFVGYWRPEGAPRLSKTSWAAGIGIAVLIAALIILSWAIPAAITGGKEFARMIFWEQSAGRMVKSFDHQLPFWFYVPVILIVMFPLFFFAPLWRGVRAHKGVALPNGVKFLASWMVPAVVAFSLISGKQPHYLLPLLAGAGIVAAYYASSVEWLPRDRFYAFIPHAVPFLLMFIVPVVALRLPEPYRDPFFYDGLGLFNHWMTLAGLVLTVGVFLMVRRPMMIAYAGAASSGLAMAIVAIQADPVVFRYLDLDGIAAAIKTYEDRPIGYIGDYEGEVTYLARLRRPVAVLDTSSVYPWLKENPTGVVMFRHKTRDPIPRGIEVVYSQRFRVDVVFSIGKAKE